MPSHILVTGASGYLGGRVASFLQSAGYKVRCAAGSRSNEWLNQQDDWLSLDVTKLDECRDAVAGIDSIIHLAALDEIASAADPVRALKVNTMGTFHLLDAFSKNGINAEKKTVLYGSTAHVYGPLEGEISEMTPPASTHPYGYTHLAAECIVRSFVHSKSMFGCSLRFSNIIGAPLTTDITRWSLIGNDLCREAVTKSSVTLKTAGLQQRNFVGMSDFLDAIIYLLKMTPSQLNGLALNLGGSASYSMRQIAELVTSRWTTLSGRKPTLNVPEAAQNTKTAPLLFRSRILENLGFKWKGDLSKEIDETLRFCEAHFGP